MRNLNQNVAKATMSGNASLNVSNVKGQANMCLPSFLPPISEPCFCLNTEGEIKKGVLFAVEEIKPGTLHG